MNLGNLLVGLILLSIMLAKPLVGFLNGQPESMTFPVFERNYQLLLDRLKQGEDLTLPVAKALRKDQ